MSISSEFVSISSEFERIEAPLLTACERVYGERLVAVVVFGSAGRGSPGPDSDVDLLVIADPLPSGRIPRVQEFGAVDELMATHVDRAWQNGIYMRLSPVFKTPDEVRRGSPLFLDMTEDARVLYDRGGFFAQEMEHLKVRLRQLGARRIWRGSAWYWDLKPDYKPGEVFDI